jgi:hypothetical protein
MFIARDLLRYNKRDNSKPAEKAKARIREIVLAGIGEENARVLDCFAGEGRMYQAVWKQAAGYVGIDRDQWFADDERVTFKADNLRVLRAIDLRNFNIFDLDAHGSPWHQAYIIAARRGVAPGERLGLAITDGLGLKMNMGGAEKAFAKLAHIKTHMPGMGAAREELVERALQGLFRMFSAAPLNAAGRRKEKRVRACSTSASY